MPSSQDIAIWVESTLNNPEWQTINKAILYAIEKNMPQASESTHYDLLEAHESYVEEILRNKLAEVEMDGGISTFEIDKDESYIKSINGIHTEILLKLRKMNPFKFEEICKLILEKIGGDADVTQKSYDGGVDFYAFNLRNYSDQFSLPSTSSISVIGQAKRYQDSNPVKETELRKFVGGALLKVDEFRKSNNINVLSPVIYAFWTTSSFHMHAKTYAKKMGIWFMDGMTITDYVIKFELVEQIDSL